MNLFSNINAAPITACVIYIIAILNNEPINAFVIS